MQSGYEWPNQWSYLLEAFGARTVAAADKMDLVAEGHGKLGVGGGHPSVDSK